MEAIFRFLLETRLQGLGRVKWCSNGQKFGPVVANNLVTLQRHFFHLVAFSAQDSI